jgi:hypothetical protein
MSPEASFTFGRSIMVSTVPRSTNPSTIAEQLSAAASAGAKVALMTEEDFAGGKGAGEKINGAMVIAVAAAAKASAIAVVCPFRLLADDGRSFNAAVVIAANGTLLKATLTGATHYEKVRLALSCQWRTIEDGKITRVLCVCRCSQSWDGRCYQWTMAASVFRLARSR